MPTFKSHPVHGLTAAVTTPDRASRPWSRTRCRPVEPLTLAERETRALCRLMTAEYLLDSASRSGVLADIELWTRRVGRRERVLRRIRRLRRRGV